MKIKNFKSKIEKYIPSQIEPKWQEKWESEGFYKVKDFVDKKKFYILIEFPYPSGAGLHVGHARSWFAMDAYARKKRMQGYNVLYPIGWDAFGLPAENYAIKMGIHPSKTVTENIERFKKQCKSLGLSFDWSREINTTDKDYYKWTQWIFLKFFEKGLAYQADVPVNWCSQCKTNLADEEVLADGKHERCGCQTEKRMQKQWLLKITKYADRLLEDLKTVDYSPKIRIQQENWIGKSEGATIEFAIYDLPLSIEVFTTRPDTIFGVTALVIAPEHPLIASLLKSKVKEIEKYVKTAKSKSELERTALEKEKTGVFTGLYAINPINNEKIPVWIGDYVIGWYGKGAVMFVPGHDQRDYDFAKKYGLEIREVVKGGDIKKAAYEGEGKLINSGKFNGLNSKQARKTITEWLKKHHFGDFNIQFKIRDWVFSRQHYWGEPIPIIHCEKCGAVAVPYEQLPVELPYLEKYEPSGTGESPLVHAEEWVKVACPECGGAAQRETDTMPNWAGSNWYYLRYLDPKNNQALAGKEKMDYWMPINIYQGGFEHTTLHLLYSRFVYKFLYDIGAVPTKEPYAKRRSHGIVLGPDGRKMSKSFGNVIDPDGIVGKFGADTLRLYEMFMGPFDQTIAWSEEGVEGCFRFFKRVWQLALNKTNEVETSKKLLTALNKTIKKVDGDLEELKFNTAVASMMEFINSWQEDENGLNKEDLKKFLLILAPFAPYMTEELWQRVRFLEVGSGKLDFENRNLDNQEIKDSKIQDQENPISNFKNSIHSQSWPSYNPKLLEEDEIIIVVQVNGKVRGLIKDKRSKIPTSPRLRGAGKDKKSIEERAKENKRVRKYLDGRKIEKVVYVEGKIINFVVE